MPLDLTARLDQHHLVAPTTIAEADQVLLLLLALITTVGLPLVVVLFLQEHKVEALVQEATTRLAVAVAHLEATAHLVAAAVRVEVTVRQAAVVVVVRPAVAALVAAAVAVAHLAVDLAGEVNRSHII